MLLEKMSVAKIKIIQTVCVLHDDDDMHHQVEGLEIKKHKFKVYGSLILFLVEQRIAECSLKPLHVTI